MEKLCKQRTHLTPATLQHLLTFAVRHAECIESIEDAQARAPRAEDSQSTAHALSIHSFDLLKTSASHGLLACDAFYDFLSSFILQERRQGATAVWSWDRT